MKLKICKKIVAGADWLSDEFGKLGDWADMEGSSLGPLPPGWEVPDDTSAEQDEPPKVAAWGNVSRNSGPPSLAEIQREQEQRDWFVHPQEPQPEPFVLEIPAGVAPPWASVTSPSARSLADIQQEQQAQKQTQQDRQDRPQPQPQWAEPFKLKARVGVTLLQADGTSPSIPSLTNIQQEQQAQQQKQCLDQPTRSEPASQPINLRILRAPHRSSARRPQPPRNPSHQRRGGAASGRQQAPVRRVQRPPNQPLPARGRPRTGQLFDPTGGGRVSASTRYSRNAD